jgi:hypothetical protein
MVDFGSEQGLSNFETAGIAGYVEDFKRAKTPLRAKRCRLWMGTNQCLLSKSKSLFSNFSKFLNMSGFFNFQHFFVVLSF